MNRNRHYGLGHKIIIVLAVLYSIVYAMSTLTSCVPPYNNFLLTFLALMFPYLFIGVILVSLLIILLFGKKGWFMLLIIALGYKNIGNCFALNFKKPDIKQKTPGTFRLLSWNVDEFLNSAIAYDAPDCPRRKILAFIKETNADILCLQDFSSVRHHGFYNNVKYIADTLHYPYYFISRDNDLLSDTYDGYGTAIFSRFPIIDTFRVHYENMLTPEHFNYADILVHNDTIRFFNTHFRSMRLKEENPDIATSPLIPGQKAASNDKSIIHKLIVYDRIHAQQSELVKRYFKLSTHPFVFCADMNSVPSSYVYGNLSKGLHDSFLQRGLGLGGTFDGIAPSIRIDVTLMSKSINASQYFSPHLHSSDHYPIMTDLYYTPNK